MRLQLLTARRLAPFLLIGATCAVLLWFGVFGRTGHGDVDLYHSYAAGFWAGDPPFSQLPLEYPPLALAVFTLTVLPPLEWYPLVFGLWMAAIFVTALAAYAHLVSRRAAVLLGVYMAVGGLGTLLSRYDLVPALATAGALIALNRRHFTVAYLLLAAGILLKLYPAVLLPIIAIEHRRALNGAGEGLLPRPVVVGIARGLFVVACGFLAAGALAGAGTLSPFQYALERPIQVESVPATLLLLLSPLGYPVTPDHSFGAFNLLSSLSPAVSALASISLLAGCLFVYWRQARGLITPGRAFVACICVVLVTGKVFSPQYVLWLLVLVAVLQELDPLWLALAVGTALVYPLAYGLGGVDGPPTVAYTLPFLALVAVRNLVMVLLAWRSLAPVPTPVPAPVPAPAAKVVDS